MTKTEKKDRLNAAALVGLISAIDSHTSEIRMGVRFDKPEKATNAKHALRQDVDCLLALMQEMGL